MRIAARVMGGSAILVALLGDRVGLGSGGFGGIQALAVALGCGLLVLGWAGSRTPAWYRGIAVMLLNVVVLLTLLELGAALVLKVLERRAARSEVEQGTRASSYYKSTNWAPAYWREFDRACTGTIPTRSGG